MFVAIVFDICDGHVSSGGGASPSHPASVIWVVLFFALVSCWVALPSSSSLGWCCFVDWPRLASGSPTLHVFWCLVVWVFWPWRCHCLGHVRRSPFLLCDALFLTLSCVWCCFPSCPLLGGAVSLGGDALPSLLPLLTLPLVGGAFRHPPIVGAAACSRRSSGWCHVLTLVLFLEARAEGSNLVSSF